MLRSSRTLVLFLAVTILTAGGAMSTSLFEYKPGVVYENIDASETLHEFFGMIKTDIPAGDDLLVEIDSYLPNGWFAQFCQTSTGICYFTDAVITLSDNSPDELRIDFLNMNAGEVAKAWVDLRISRVADPSYVREVTYAIGHGLVLPEVTFGFYTDEAFVTGNPGDTLELVAPFFSSNSFPDSLRCSFTREVPATWFSQFCQTSTGVCYFQDVTIPFPSFHSDEMRIDFFTDGTDPGIGLSWLKLQSVENPSAIRKLTFRGRTGDIPAGLDDELASSHFSVVAAPNPMRETTDLQILLERPSRIHMQVVDATGRIVTSRMTPPLGVGPHQLRWTGNDDQGRSLPNGIYFYRIETDRRAAEGKLTIER